MQPPRTVSATPVTMGRPSLYIAQEMQGNASVSGSILGELESAHPRLKAHKIFIAVLFVVALGVALWTITREGVHLRVPVDSAPPAMTAENSPQATTSPLVEAPEAMSPAPIIADPVAETTPVPLQRQENPPAEGQSLVAHEQSLSPREELVAATSAAMQTPPALPATASASAGNPATGDKALQMSALESQAAKKSPTPGTTRPTPVVAAAQKPQATATPRAVSSAASVKTTEKDGDVELIAALLNRVSSKTDKNDLTAVDALRKSTPETGRKVAASAAAPKKARKATGIRETVITKPADTAQAQLERCNTLGFFEAEMCRLRACTGRWGSDPACPEYAQNSNVAP